MTGDEVKKKISELEALRSQARLWRIGATCAIVLIVVLCVGSLVNSVHNLFPARAGPGSVHQHTDHGSETGRSAERADSLPPRRSPTASRRWRRPLPSSMAASRNSRALRSSSWNLLQHNLPERGDKVLNATYGVMLKKHEAKIKTLFPEATDENVAAHWSRT